jgi:tRNA pseudouridine13 synthase
MPSHADQELWQREQEFLKTERERIPDQFLAPPRTPELLYPRIGITSFPKNLPKGYIKYSPLDFIVEEMKGEQKVVTVDRVDPNPVPLMEGTGTVYADLVKVGLSTLDANARIADALHLEAKQVGHAGIKDAVALTAQTISIRGSSLDAVRALQIPQLFLKHVVEGKGAVQIGSLYGNRFTLFIRTEGEPDERNIADRIRIINSGGVPNYYGTQRFGFRFLSHLLGMHVLRGEPELAVHATFTKTNPFEPAYYQNIRAEIAKVFGDWKKVREIVERLPHTFRYESVILDVLERERGADAYAKALAAIPDQTDLWCKAYGSYLTNLALSEFEEAGRQMPEKIPLFLSTAPEAAEFYQKWAESHGTTDFRAQLNRFGFTKFINIGTPTAPSRVWPNILAHKVLPEGVAICFELTKGAYATTVLMFFFDVVAGYPTPEWLRPIEVDTKQLLGFGNLTDVKLKLGDAIRQMMEKKTELGESSD